MPVTNEEQVEPGSSKLLNSLLELSNKASGKSEDASSGSSFPVYIILTGLVMLGFAIMGWLAVRAKRQAAQLEYELRKKEEELARSREQVKLDQDAEIRKTAEGKVAGLTSSIQELKEKLQVIEVDAADRARALAKATSWNDLVVTGGRS
jgi:uncharacterized protein HemX